MAEFRNFGSFYEDVEAVCLTGLPLIQPVQCSKQCVRSSAFEFQSHPFPVSDIPVQNGQAASVGFGGSFEESV